MRAAAIADKVKNAGRERDEAYRDWALEHCRKEEVDGVYLLVTKHPSHLQLEVGLNTRKCAFTEENLKRLREILLKAFNKKDFDGGLLEGVRYVDKTIGENLGRATNQSSQQTAPSLVQCAEHQIQQVTREHVNPAPVQRHSDTGGGIMGWVVVLLIVLVGFWILKALFRGITGGMGRGGPYPGGPGAGGGPGYPPAGYGGGYGGGGGGGSGFMGNMLGGLFGAAAGNWIYDSMFRGGGGGHFGGGETGGTGGGFFGGGSADSTSAPDTDYSGTGGDFGDSSQADSGGGDFGGDSGGGDSGGGDFGGGDFGGGDSGGGDSGGGDF